jgi:RHS repeat-associated protein
MGSTGQAMVVTGYGPVFYYYHPDHLGSSNVITDRSGNVVQHYGYTTFGQNFYQYSTTAFPVSNRYTGQIADDETGLYYYGGRYYDAQLGRFIQPDPTVPDPEDSQSLNRYSYCRNNPLNETDPTGFDDSSLDGSDGNGGTWYGGYVWLPNISSQTQISLDAYSGVAQTFTTTTICGLTFTTCQASGNGWTMTGNYFDGELISGSLSTEQFVPDYNADGGSVGGHYETTTLSYDRNAAPAAVGPSASGGGGWLAGVTNLAGLVAALPIPWVSGVAGLVNVAGEALQGNYAMAAVGLGTSALAMVGLGVLGAVVKDAVKSTATAATRATQLEFQFAKDVGSSDVTYLYQKVGAAGEHLKFGITDNPATRYTTAELNGGSLNIIAHGERSEMLDLERQLHETLPIGPEEGQLFYIQKQVEQGLKPPPY